MLRSRQTGTVKWFSDEKGYGFIEQTEGIADVFVHYSSILENGYRTLDKNQPVEYDVMIGPRGKYAEKVVVIKN